MVFKVKLHNFEGEEHYHGFKKVCEDIAAKDSTFKFDSDDERLLVYVFADDKDLAYKRGLWLVKKADPLNRIVFEVE